MLGILRHTDTCTMKLNRIVLPWLILGMLALTACHRSWDEVSGPDRSERKAMASVNKFIESYGWNMQRSGFLFETNGKPARLIRDLPWKEMQNKQYPAVTYDGVLYVLLERGPGGNRSGVAYNPLTNMFVPSVRGYRPIGSRWYVWVQPENQTYTYLNRYE